MGIKFRCQSCDKKLHVKAFLAGKRGVCPSCGAKFRIPEASQQTRPSGAGVASAAGPTQTADHNAGGTPAAKHASSTSAKSSPSRTETAPAPSAPRQESDPVSEAPEAVWYVRPPSGGQFGPADGEIMRRWLDEGRVSADSLVWREGWPDWKTAASVFPTLQQPFSQPAETTAADSAVARPEVPITVVDKRPATRHLTPRSTNKSVARNVAIIVGMSVICVALLVVLYLVLRGQG